MSRWLSLMSQQQDHIAASSASRSSLAAILGFIFFPTLPPLVQTFCYVCRVVSLLIVAPIVLVAVVDFAEYAVIRTLGLRRRKVRVKTQTSSSSTKSKALYNQGRMQLSPAQLRRQTTLQHAPLLTPGAYDAETLLRHRARSISSASSQALEEWSRTNGSFARVAEVRAASASNSQAPSPPSGASDASTPPDQSDRLASFDEEEEVDYIGSIGALGLSESEAEGDSGIESGPSSPTVGFSSLSGRQGLKGSQFNFTPIQSRTTTIVSKSPPEQERIPLLGINPDQLAAAADLEQDTILSTSTSARMSG
ncbi:unnamed protein product [Sympodiomycopsis kandeliae]